MMQTISEQEEAPVAQTAWDDEDEAFLREWLMERKYARRRLTLWFLCGTVIVVLLFYAADHSEHLFEMIAVVSFFAMLIYIWALSYSNRKAMRQLWEEYPELLATNDEWSIRETQHRKRFHQKQWVILLLGVVGMIFLRTPFVLVIAAIAAAYVGRSDQTLQQAPVIVRLQENEKKHTQRLGCLWALIPVLATGVILLESMLGFVANARVSTMNSNARYVYQTATQWQQEQDECNLPFALQTQIINCSVPAEEGSFAAYLQDMTSLQEYCAIVCDEDGKVQYALYAKIPITENQLTPMTLEEQRRIESSLFTRGQAVGCYRP